MFKNTRSYSKSIHLLHAIIAHGVHTTIILQNPHENHLPSPCSKVIYSSPMLLITNDYFQEISAVCLQVWVKFAERFPIGQVGLRGIFKQINHKAEHLPHNPYDFSDLSNITRIYFAIHLHIKHTETECPIKHKANDPNNCKGRLG